MIGLFRVRNADPEVCTRRVSPYSQLAPNASRRASEGMLTKLDAINVPQATSSDPARWECGFDKPTAPLATNHLYASGPISVSVLRRALPQRFAQIEGRQRPAGAEETDESIFVFTKGAVV